MGFFHCLIQAQVTVIRINAPVELPSYISNNQSIIGLTKSRKTGESYRDNLFLFRCGCHHLMKKRDERKTKKRLCSMVPSCLSCSKPFDDSENIQSLFDLKLIGQVFLNSYVKEKYKAGRIKSYLMSLRNFYSFLLSDKPDGMVRM